MAHGCASSPPTRGRFDGGKAWSPDGGRIAFDSDRDGNPELYRMGANGSDQTRLTFNEASDFLSTWSPDGRKLAFTTDRDGNFEVYTMRADGSQQVNPEPSVRLRP